VDLSAAIAHLGGIARTRELRNLGFTPQAIAAGVHLGRIQRLRIGWFGSPSLPDLLVRAHRVGGVPACASVAQAHQLWMLREPRLHIEVERGDSRFRSQRESATAIPIRARDDVVVHWVDRSIRSPRTGQPLVIALAQMVGCVPELEAVATIDSALHRKLVTLDDLVRTASGRARPVIERCDPRAESGVESFFRLRAFDSGFTFRTQVPFPGSRVDFLFGDRLIVEVDGEEHHSGPAAFAADRERDAWYAALGYLVIRLTYAQVIHRWHEVDSLLRLVHARGDQFWPYRIRKSARRAAEPAS
jgi:very-short-patch-repair endonuclease